jgi:hypothetical protein
MWIIGDVVIIDVVIIDVLFIIMISGDVASAVDAANVALGVMPTVIDDEMFVIRN